jgi:alginate O-acetyltransferase complex protein AlgJ
MQRLYRTSRYIVPLVFFGYAPFANLAFLEDPAGKLAPFDMGVLKGTLTHSFDTAYKGSMPHRDASIGLIGAGRYLLIGEGRKGVLTGDDGWLFTAEEARPLPGDLPGSLDQIAAVKQRLADAGVTLVLVPVPAKMDVEAARARQPQLSAMLAGLYGDFVAGLAARQVAVIDTRAPLVALAATMPAFIPTDTHWSPEGAAAVATAVAASGLVPVGATAMQKVPQPSVQLTGDLVSFVTSDALAPFIGLPACAITPYLGEVPLSADSATADLGNIFAADAVGVVLVGTSYSANPDWSFAEALKLAMQTDVLNAAAEGRGPVQPMVDYLASDAFRDTPPEVVLWEFPIRYLTDPKLWKPTQAAMEVASAN